jgi:hypothetical protein
MIVLLDEAQDCRLQFSDGSEDAAFEPPPRELGKEALDRVEPRTRGRSALAAALRAASQA